MCSLERRGNIFYLTLTGDGEHRLSPTVIAQIRSALQQVRDQSPASGSALVTTAQGSKFFSNGFDLAWAARPQPEGFGSVLNGLRLMIDLFRPVVADMMSLPMPTVAVVTGHAAAAGMLLALCHDYVFMREDRGVLYMSELDIGITLPDYFMAAIRSKIVSPATRRDVLLKASKLRAAEAAKMGIIDSAHENGEKAMEAAVRLVEQLVKRNWDGEVYGEIRKDMYPELCGVLGLRAKEVVSASSKL